MTIPSHAELLREYLEQLSQPGAESRLPVWTDWVRLRSLGSAMAIGAALTLAACDSDTDPTNGNGNIAGGAGVGQLGTGGMNNTTAIYAAPLTGGTTATGSGGMNMTALYAVMMTGGTSATTSNTGGVAAGTRYAVPLGGSAGASVTTAAGGASAVVLYGAPMEKSSAPAVGPNK